MNFYPNPDRPAMTPAFAKIKEKKTKTTEPIFRDRDID
jgi:hypothetical protein